MSVQPKPEDGMCLAYAIDSVCKFYNKETSVPIIWDACKERRAAGGSPFFITTSSASNYLNIIGIPSSVFKVTSITTAMDLLNEQGSTCITIMRWRKTMLGHAYVFLGVNRQGQYCFLDPDTPEKIKKFSPLDLHDCARRRSEEVVGNEVIYVYPTASQSVICPACSASIAIVDNENKDNTEYVLCLKCNRYMHRV